MKKAIIILSGGLDSTVVLAKALENRECIAISFDYDQKHIAELEAAKKIAEHYQVLHQIVKIPPFLPQFEVQKNRDSETILNGGIPTTYVPGRNTLFLSFAQSFAELYEADEIHFGANAMYANGYPDTRPEYLEAFQNMMNLATKRAAPNIITPLLHLEKKDIILEGSRLNAPLYLTISCYEGTNCGACDACTLRKEGFISAHQPDPTLYQDQSDLSPQ